MTNEIRGERAIAFGARKIPLALTFASMAKIEAAFHIENFEAVAQKLGSIVVSQDQERFYVNAGGVLKFWRAVLEGNGHDAAWLEQESFNPYDLAFSAFALLQTAREKWFLGTAEENQPPLAQGRAGDIG